MFKIKSLLCKDLILNSRGCRKSNQLLRHPHRFWYNQRHPCRYWKILNVSGRTGMSGVISSSDVFAQQKLDVEKCTRMYTFQHACGCFLLAPCSFRTDKDVRGSKQKRCFCAAKTRVRKCTRTYTSGQAIFKRLTEKVFSKKEGLRSKPNFSAGLLFS